jgi:hypothetical protein
MPLNDYNNRLTPTAQAFTSTGAVTTNSQPLPATGADIGAGEPMGLEFTLTAVSAASGTIQLKVQTATNADGTTGSVVLAQTIAITDTTLAAGDKVVLPIPVGLIPIVAATATHIAGFITLASSGTCTAIVDLKPLNACRGVVYTAGTPTMAVFA